MTVFFCLLRRRSRLLSLLSIIFVFAIGLVLIYPSAKYGKFLMTTPGVAIIIAIPSGPLSANPCGPDSQYLEKTLQSILDTTPNLVEVVIVDDGTQPPIKHPVILGLSEESINKQRPKLRWIRNINAIGLGASRKLGADTSHAEMVVFFDCYIKPRLGWDLPVIEYLQRNPKGVAVPTLIDLDEVTWEERSGARKESAKAVMHWEVEYHSIWDLPLEGSVPIEGTGIVAFRSWWFREINGYDTEWAGSATTFMENVELSLRVWNCGGQIHQLEHSVLGYSHQQHGTLHHLRPDVLFLQARIIRSWFGAWTSRGLSAPQFVDFLEGKRGIGDLEEIRAMQMRVGCTDIRTFLKKFEPEMRAGGMLPREVFMLREQRSGFCLQQRNRKTWVMSSCTGGRGQFFQHKNVEFSGLGPWNTGPGPENLCLNYDGNVVSPYTCDRSAKNRNQKWILNVSDGQFEVGGSGVCLVSKETLRSDDSQSPSVEPHKQAFLGLGSCVETKEDKVAENQRFSIIAISAEENLFYIEVEVNSIGRRCLSSDSHNEITIVSMVPCTGTSSQIWEWLEPDRKLGLRNQQEGKCLDMNSGMYPLLYACYPMNDKFAYRGITNTNQAIQHSLGGWLRVWTDLDDSIGNLCLEVALESVLLPITAIAVLPCFDARAQGIYWSKIYRRIPSETDIFNSLNYDN